MNMAVYTPKAIVDIIVTAGFRLFDHFKTNPTRILDPAVGTGNILIEIWNRLRDRGYLDSDIDNMVHGIDIDEYAIETCKSRLKTELRLNKIPSNIYPCEYLFEFVDLGFDLIIMNPPFLGGSKISGTFGDFYKEDIVDMFGKDRNGVGDLSAYFLRKSSDVSLDKAVISLVATNTISQGATRRVGLKHLVDNGWIIYDANRNIKWPAEAIVTVSTCALYRGF